MTYQRSNSVLKPNPSAMVGNATVKILDLITFRKLTPATMVIMIAALRLYGTSIAFSPSWSYIRISSNDVSFKNGGNLLSKVQWAELVGYSCSWHDRREWYHVSNEVSPLQEKFIANMASSGNLISAVRQSRQLIIMTHFQHLQSMTHRTFLF